MDKNKLVAQVGAFVDSMTAQDVKTLVCVLPAGEPLPLYTATMDEVEILNAFLALLNLSIDKPRARKTPKTITTIARALRDTARKFEKASDEINKVDVRKIMNAILQDTKNISKEAE